MTYIDCEITEKPYVDPNLQHALYGMTKRDKDICVLLKDRYITLLSQSEASMCADMFYTDPYTKQWLEKLYPNKSLEDAHQRFIARKICTEVHPRIQFKGLMCIGLEGVHDECPQIDSFNAAVLYVMKKYNTCSVTWHHFWRSILSVHSLSGKTRKYFIEGDMDRLLHNLRAIKGRIYFISEKKNYVKLRCGLNEK